MTLSLIAALRRTITRVTKFLEFTLPRSLRCADKYLSNLQEGIRRRRKEKYDRRLRPLPRVWSLVGGVHEMRASKFILDLFPGAYDMKHDEFVTRWFVGRTPVAEVVPDPSGYGSRVFINENIDTSCRLS